MKTITIKNYGGLTYVNVQNVPIKDTEFGEVIDLEPGAIEQLVALAILEYKSPIRGAEFRIIKSALKMSNEAIASQLGISRNTVLKWGKEINQRLPLPYEMLMRLLASQKLGLKITVSIDELKANDRPKKINLKAA